MINSTITKYTQVFGIGKNRSVNSEEQFSAFNRSQLLHINLLVGSATPIFIKKKWQIFKTLTKLPT